MLLYGILMNNKICIYCNEEKEIKYFSKHKNNKDGFDNRCKQCKNKHKSIRDKLRKNAPPKPNICECCGIVSDKLVLDHDHKTKEFRGWICNQCNHGIGKLGDSIEGLERAIKYLKGKI